MVVYLENETFRGFCGSLFLRVMCFFVFSCVLFFNVFFCFRCFCCFLLSNSDEFHLDSFFGGSKVYGEGTLTKVNNAIGMGRDRMTYTH